jgi:hypothetical protein
MTKRGTEIESSGFVGPITRRSYRWSKQYTAEQYLQLLQTQSDPGYTLRAVRDRPGEGG